MKTTQETPQIQDNPPETFPDIPMPEAPRKRIHHGITNTLGRLSSKGSFPMTHMQEQAILNPPAIEE